MNSSPGRTLARGAAWMIFSRLLDRLLGVVSMLILARVLTPSDFGLVAMATALMALIELFGAFGLDVALIQRQGATRDHFDSAWTMNVSIGLAVACLLLLFAWPLAYFYEETRLVPLVAFLALGPAIQGFENIGVVAFRKDLEFGREFRFLLIKRMLTFAVVVPLALWLRSYWALAIGMVFGRLAGVVVSYLLHPFRPRWSFGRARDLLRFSAWLVAQNLVVFLKDRAPDFIVGKLAGAHALGLLNVANELSALAGTELIAPMNRAALPTYSRFANDVNALSRAYLEVAGIVALLVTPLVTGLAALAPLVVAVLLGPKWQAAVGLIQWLAFLGLTNIFLGTSHAPVLARGRPEIFVKIYIFQVVLLLPLSYFLTRAYGVEGAAIAAVATAIGLLPVNISLVARTIGIRAGQLLKEVWRPLIAAGGMYLAIDFSLPPLAMGDAALVRSLALLGLYVPFGGLVYAAIVLTLWWVSGRPASAEKRFLNQAGRIGSRLLRQFRSS